MALNLDDLAERVNDNIATPTTTPTTDQAVAVAAALAPDYQSELATARAEIEALRAERDAQAESLAAARLKTIADNAAKPLQPIASGAQDLRLQKAVTAVGGLARWNQLSSVDRCKAVGIDGSEQVTDSELLRYFGPNSSAAAAQLARTSNNLYQKYRAIFRARGL